MNKPDVVPAEVSARQGHASKRGAEQGGEAADTSLAKGIHVNTRGICGPSVGSKFCLLQLPGEGDQNLCLGLRMGGL